MNPGAGKKRTPDPSTTRTDKDWVMIALGVLLIILFVAGAYMSLVPGDKGAGTKLKGPVKDPKRMGMSEPWHEDGQPIRVDLCSALRMIAPPRNCG